jgi:hypothetical protein
MDCDTLFLLLALADEPDLVLSPRLGARDFGHILAR